MSHGTSQHLERPHRQEEPLGPIERWPPRMPTLVLVIKRERGNYRGICAGSYAFIYRDQVVPFRVIAADVEKGRQVL